MFLTIVICPRSWQSLTISDWSSKLERGRLKICFAFWEFASIARPSRDGKTRRARARGHFAPRVSKGNCPSRYGLGPRLGQPRVRPTPRPPSPRPHRESRGQTAALVLSKCGDSCRGIIGTKNRRFLEGSVRGLGSQTRKASRDASGGCR